MNAFKFRLRTVLAFVGTTLLLSNLAHASQPPIVGSWLLNGGGNVGVTTFLSNGYYMDAMVVSGDSAHTGVEFGTYSWDATSGKITATSSVDTNGNWGFAGDVDGPQYITVTGNTATLFQPGCPSCTGPLTRVVQDVAAIPEPETYAMMLAGLGLLGAVLRRRKDKQQ